MQLIKSLLLPKKTLEDIKMSMTLSTQVSKKIIKRLLQGADYRIEVVTLINAEFLQYTIAFFKRVVEAKLKNKNITSDWYKKEFLASNLDKTDIAINGRLNMKTIHNMFHSTRKEIVLDAATEHYDVLYQSIKELTETEGNLALTLTIKFNGVSVDLNISESLIVINTLAVKRAALRGALWSTAGKRVEQPLMETLCKLFGVPKENYHIACKNKDGQLTFEREVDFYLKNGKEEFKCEVKLMGKGNPESADVVIARSSRIFVADKLSDTNKKQLDHLNVQWVEMSSKNGFLRFKEVLKNLNIPYNASIIDFSEEKIDRILTSSQS